MNWFRLVMNGSLTALFKLNGSMTHQESKKSLQAMCFMDRDTTAFHKKTLLVLNTSL